MIRSLIITITSYIGLLIYLSIFAPGQAMAATTTNNTTEDSDEYLYLADAERTALQNDPQVAAALARARAFTEQSTAAGQLADPQLKLGLFNLPIDDFDYKKNPTTQFRLGVNQKFPRGDTLKLKTLRDEWLSNAENAMAEVNARSLLRDIRQIWLDIWYQQSAQLVIQENRELFQQLVLITEGQYAAGRAIQQDVIRADLELSRLDDRLLNSSRAEKGLRGRLMRWIGSKGQLALPKEKPVLAAPANTEAILTGLSEHPALLQKSAQLEAQERSVDIAREQYKPGWSLGGEYRQRFGEDPDGSNRDNMIAVMATIDLPVFTAKRQDKQLAAAQEKADAVWLSRQDMLQKLQSEYYWRMADEEELQQRLKLYNDYLLRDAKANAEAALQAYQAGVTEFTTLMRASITELDVQLQALRVQVDLLKNHAHLQWLNSDQIQYSTQNQRQSERPRGSANSGE